jgi:aminoglycoside phosphotransferase (APT) family kinase protein
VSAPAAEIVVVEAAQQAGLGARAVELMRDGSHAVFRLSGGVIARVGPPDGSTLAGRAVLVARWLEGAGVAAVQPLSGVPQPTIVWDRPVTWWHELPPHRPASPAELGAVLRRLHGLSVPVAPALAELDPFVQFTPRIEDAGWLAADDRDWLVRNIERLRDQWSHLPPGRPECVVHGDAWQGNVAVPDGGEPIVLDLDRFAVGPPEWDLVAVAADHVDFGRVPAAEYRGFVAAYGGYDVLDWPGFRTAADIVELRWLCFALELAARDDRVRPEARHRLACLRGRVPRPWTWTAL